MNNKTRTSKIYSIPNFPKTQTTPETPFLPVSQILTLSPKSQKPSYCFYGIFPVPHPPLPQQPFPKIQNLLDLAIFCKNYHFLCFFKPDSN